MPTGSCLCGTIQVSYEGDPVMKGLCHCHDCRKISGYPLVFGIPKANFKVTSGEPRKFTKVSDSGRELSSYFCGSCGTTLYRINQHPDMKNLIMFRAPVLDQIEEFDSEKGTPTAETYCERRPDWLKPIEGAIQLDSQYRPMEIEENALDKVIT
jgi:hypothetical protein